jgi:hypothetical protein
VTRYYEKSHGSDEVPFDSLYHQINLTNRITWDSSINLWKLDDIQGILDEIKKEDELL